MKRRNAIITYCLLSLLVLGAMARFEAYVRAEQRDDAFNDYKLCLVAQDNRNVLRDLIDRQSAPLEPPPDSSPALIEAIRQSQESGDQARKEMLARLGQDAPKCVDPNIPKDP